MNLDEIIALAHHHFNEASGDAYSVEFTCICDAVALKKMGQPAYAKARAIRSLSYTIGEDHPDYMKAYRGA
jgi:hypothetical protein